MILSNQQIEARILSPWEKGDKVTSVKKGKVGWKSRKRRKSGEFEAERKEFIGSLDLFFDILNCHCPIILCKNFTCENSCEKDVHVECSCPRAMEIPVFELVFIYHQREKRGEKSRMMIAAPDIDESRKQEKAMERKREEDRREAER